MIWRIVLRSTGQQLAAFEASDRAAADRMADRIVGEYSRLRHNLETDLDPFAGFEARTPAAPPGRRGSPFFPQFRACASGAVTRSPRGYPLEESTGCPSSRAQLNPELGDHCDPPSSTT